MSFTSYYYSYYYSHDFIIYCYINRKYKLRVRTTKLLNPTLPPPSPQLKKVNSDKYFIRWCCSKNYGFLF